MGQGRSNKDDGGSVFVLLCILVLIVGIVAAAGMIMAVLNYNNNNDTPVNINMGGSDMPSSGGPAGGSGGGKPSGGPDKGPPGRDDVHYDTRVWTIQTSGDSINRVSYIDPRTRQLKGYLVDLVNAVCLIAGKNCDLITSDFATCWNDGFPQEGLLGKWYDACALWAQSLDRLRAYKFSHAFTPTARPVFLTLPGNPTSFDPDNLGGRTIGFLAGWWADRYCLLFSTGDELADGQIFVYNSGSELLTALRNREVDAAFVSQEVGIAEDGSTQVEVVETVTPCLQGGNSMMMRKDSLFRDWWNPAFEKLMNSRTYRGICDDVDDPAVHGNLPGPSANDLCNL